MTTHQADLACKFVDLAAQVIKEVLRSRAGIPTNIQGLYRASTRPIIRKRKLMDR